MSEPIDRRAWLDSLGVGSEVACGKIYESAGRLFVDYVRQVRGIDGDYIEVRGMRYRRSDGLYAGQYGSVYGAHGIYPVTDEARAQDERNTLLSAFDEGEWGKMTTDQLRRILAIVAGSKGKPE